MDAGRWVFAGLPISFVPSLQLGCSRNCVSSTSEQFITRKALFIARHEPPAQALNLVAMDVCLLILEVKQHP